MNMTFSSKQKFILFGAIFFCLGIAVGTFGNLGTHAKLSSQYLSDPSLTCTRECYWASRGTFTVPGEESCPSEPICGNGTAEGNETCDDGNMNNNDGCSSTCSPDTMMAVSYCGNSMCDGGEDCYSCSGDCGMCSAPSAVCGNSTIEGSETCDDGNMNNNDGCSSLCQNETRCGDGTVQWPAETNTIYEICDDGNTNDGDGCNSSCQTETINSTSYCGNYMCDSGEDCSSCSSDCGMCFYTVPTTNYSYCYDSSACNAWQWVENGTCDYSCHTPTCQSNFHVENGSCVSDQIVCREINGNMQLEYSNGNTDFSDRVVALGQTDPNKSKYEIEYSATQTILKSHMYVDGIDVPCPDITKQNTEALDEPLETCEEMLQGMRNEGENTDGMVCTGPYSFTIELNN